jgi:hypothetical protein
MDEQSRRIYCTRMRTELRSADVSIAALRTRATERLSHEDGELFAQLDRLSSEASAVRATLDTLCEAGPEEWEDVRDELKVRWSGLLMRYRHLSERVGPRHDGSP